ncbi:MAG: transcription-repair coupling factor [Casimicrobiaceae bacterium]|nr:transcription-repair coupling factor [Casimicrobiaceae bacterium]
MNDLSSDPLERFVGLLPPPPKAGQVCEQTLLGAARALSLAGRAEALAREGRMLVLLTAHAHEAATLAAELAWFAPSLTVLELPDWETLPYDHFSPHPDLVSERLKALYALLQRRCDVLVVTAATAVQRLCPRSFVGGRSFALRCGQRIEREQLRAQLLAAGYTAVTQVVAHGEFALRGGIFDFFPLGATVPARLEFDDDRIESIRHFDPDTQRTLYPVEALELLPAREFPTDEVGRRRFRERWREHFEGDPSRSAIYRDVSNGLFPGGIECYLPLFFDALETLFDYLPESAVVATVGDLHASLGVFEHETRERYRLLRADEQRPLLAPDALYLPRDALLHELKRYPRYLFPSAEGQPLPDFAPEEALPPLAVDRSRAEPLAALTHYLRQSRERILCVAESPGRAETLRELFARHGLPCEPLPDLGAALASSARFAIITGPLARGGRIPGHDLAFVTESELYPSLPRNRERRRSRPSDLDAILRDLAELKVGDPVVHEEHGIGRYRGLATLDLGDGPTEFLELEYAHEARLYVPVANLHLVSRYSGASPEQAPLHTLGSGQWERARRRAAQQARDTAAELLNLYAQRAARQGHRFRIDWNDYAEFAAGFGFEATPDQAAAIQAVLQDMVSHRPMDRLVCGDVGFGKTEVALRAAFVAVMDGRQVAVLTPTTLLAEQHFNTFRDRFAKWPVRIAELSRFRSKKDVASTLAQLAEGSIDIVIGTHRLLEPDVRFRALGLVIIDEEHRFGVRQKERLRQLRAEVDLLTLTATPIPRTLAMSLEGIRDLSVIATAPSKRLAIKTFVAKESDGLIREAILRELKRGGQVYFVHNDIDSIERQRVRLESLVPEARIEVAHGQMGALALERVMREFYQQRIQVLLCSTIIETGIDVPSANTILIHRADRFGLAQLHQLRGRVGRSHHQAYAYLLIPNEEAITADAKKRLEAITQLEELGSGFFLAMHDLEIRGAGELLGERQSGEIQEVGFSLFSAMLEQAVASLKAGREPDLDEPLGVITEVNLHTPARLPEAYCPGIHERLVLYKRLANCTQLEQLEALKEELIDRFGPLPPEAETLLAAHELRILGRRAGVKKIDAAPERSVITFGPHPPFDTARLIALVQRDARMRFAGQDRIRIERSTATLAERQRLIADFLRMLA